MTRTIFRADGQPDLSRSEALRRAPCAESRGWIRRAEPSPAAFQCLCMAAAGMRPLQCLGLPEDAGVQPRAELQHLLPREA